MDPNGPADGPSALLFKRAVRFVTPTRVDLSSPLYVALLAIVGGVTLIAVSRYARGLADPLQGFIRLSLGDVSFTEVFGVYLIGFAIGTLVSGLPSDSPTPNGPPRPPIGIGGRFTNFGNQLRGGLPATTGFAFALITILYRVDVVGRLFSPQATGYKSATDFVGTIGEAVEDIPAGGHGQITYRDQNARLAAVMAASDVNVSRGTRVRI